MGIGWLAGGMFMLYVALRRWRIDPAAAVIAPLLLPAFPRILHASTTVNPDAAAALVDNAAILRAAGEVERPEAREVIFELVYDIAVRDTIAESEAALLNELAAAWKLPQRVGEAG